MQNFFFFPQKKNHELMYITMEILQITKFRRSKGQPILQIWIANTLSYQPRRSKSMVAHKDILNKE